MDSLMQDALKKRRKGYIRTGRVKVEPIRRPSDWLLPESDSAFMNSGATVEYVVPRDRYTNTLIDPLEDLTDQEKTSLARELGLKSGDDFNVNKPDKENFWINRPVIIDKNGKFLDLANPGDFISYKILEVNLELIAPSWNEKYEKGTFKFAIVFPEEESKLKNASIDTKKEAYMEFGRIDGSVKKMTDFMWILYLVDRDTKRLPNNPSIDYLRAEVGRVIEEKPGVFLSIIKDPDFETKVLIQKAINNGLIHRDGQFFTIFNESTSRNSLEGLIGYLKDDRNNNIRLMIIGKLEAIENADIQAAKKQILGDVNITHTESNKDNTMEERMKTLEEMSKKLLLENQELKRQNENLMATVPMTDGTTNVATKRPARGKTKTE